MPGNDLGDRVHNFFARDNLSQGQHHSQVEGNWLNGTFWAGSQGHVDQLSSNSKNYNPQNSDVDRGEAGYSLQATNGLNSTQLNLRPDFAKNQSLNEHPNLNGFMYASQFHQTRQNEANFLGMDTGSENLHLITSRGLLAPEALPGAGTGHQMRAPDRPEASVSPMSFDLFGGQQQMNHQQSSTTQSLLQQHSGINNTQQLQQQLMIRKFQEIQHQQQPSRHIDLRQHYLNSQVPSFPKQSSGGQSTLVNGTANSDTSLYPWTVAAGTNWLNHGSSSMQGSPNELGFPPNLGLTQGHVDLVPQQGDQSLYGVPVSSSRGLNMNHYSQMVTSRASVPQMPITSNFHQGNQPEQVAVQGEFSMSRQRFQNDNMFGHSSKQSQHLALGDMGRLQQTNSVSRIASQKESSQEKLTRQVSLPQTEVSLDATEEKILFGSDDNIWSAFGKVPDLTGEAGSIFDNDGANGVPSIQSGSWSALMQSAVAETSRSDIVPQEEWSGVTFQKNDGPSWSRPSSFPQKSFKKEASLVDDNKRMPLALNSGSLPASDDISNNAMILNQNSRKFQKEPGQRVQSQMFSQSLQNSIPEGSQHRDASHFLLVGKNAKTTGFPGQTGDTALPNGWNALAAVLPEENSLMNDHDAENLRQNSRNSQGGLIQGGVFDGSPSWKLNSVPSSTMELGNVKSRVSNPQANQGILSLKSSSYVGICDETNPQLQNKYSLNQWTNMHLSARPQGGEYLGRLFNQANDPNQVLESVSGREKDEAARFELENRDVKENSTDSHHSNLSQHTFSGFKEGGVPEGTDSGPLSAGKQKLTNQLSRKVSVPHKFKYHPMGNVDEDVEPAYGLMQPSHVQTMLQNNAQFGQAKLFGQVGRNCTLIEKSSELRRDIKGPDEEPSCGDLSGHVTNKPVSQSQPVDTINNASSSSQNMLELFNKVDHSRNQGATMQLNSSECDGFGHLQHSQSHVSQGFGLQLGPPSQGLQIPEFPLPSQNGQGTFNSLRSNNAVAERGDKSPLLVAKHSGKSFPPEETEPEFKLNISMIPEPGGNENSLYKTPGSLASTFSSGIPFSRSNDQNQQITRASGQMSSKQLSENAYSAERRTAETLLPDASASFQQGNCALFGALSQQSGPNDKQERVPTAAIESRDGQQTSRHIAIPGHFRQENSLEMLHNMSSAIPIHKQNMSAKILQISSESLELPQPNIVESSPPLIHDLVNSPGVDGEEQRLRESTGQQVASLNSKAIPQVKNSSAKASFLKNHFDDSPSSTLMQKDIEAFGRSLKPNSFSHQNYSLLNQMQASKDLEIDPINRVSKRMKGVQSVASVHHAASKMGQQHEQNDVLGDSLGSSMPTGLLPRNPSQDGNVVSQDDLALNQDTSCINVTTSLTVDHPQISPQMAPSWFSQYGSLKNGQMLQPYNALKVTPSRPDQSLTHVKCSSDFHPVSSEDKRTVPADACQNSNNLQNLPDSLIATGGVSSLKSLQLNAAAGQNLGIVRPKKRKSPSDLCPWRKEILEVSQDHFAHSMMESGWGKASNCLTDKVVDDAELIEDGSPVLRYKRRLTLTTCLMQKLLHSPPTVVLSSDASTSSKGLVYTVSRTTLGDACSTVHHLSSLDMASDSMDLHPPKGKLAVRNGVRCYAKAADELLGRIRKLENDFSRLDKSASILDLRIECQDLEKYSVINRFARFHGRGQSDNAETSLINATATSQRPILPQRYVTALPLPRDIPDGLQCLPL